MVEKASLNPKRFDQIDKDLEHLQFIKSLVPNDDDLVKYGFSVKDSHGLYKLAEEVCMTILLKYRDSNPMDYLKAQDVKEAIRYTLGVTGNSEGAARASIWFLADRGSIKFGPKWELKLTKPAD